MLFVTPLSFAGKALVANAQTRVAPTAETVKPGTGGNGGGVTDPSVNTGVQPVVGGLSRGAAAAGDVTSGGGGSDPFEQFAYWIALIIYTFTVGIGSAIAFLGATILNTAVSFSLDSSAYNLDFISTGWVMLRDIANMTFIFMLVYIAIQVMFLAQTHGTVERLVKVLAVALIINFSFFGTRVVIDAGNLISVQFYNAITGGSTATTPDLTASIMNGLKFTSALNEDAFKQVSATVGGGSLTALIAFSFTYLVLGAALFMLAAACVTAAVKFVIRIVMLWFAIITAPLALVAWSFGGGHGGEGGHGGNYFGRWLKNLINHAFYPAVFLFVLLLITHFMSGLTDTGGFGSIAVDGNGWQGAVATLANILVRLAFVLVMLFFALKASDYFDVAGASVAKTFGNNVAFGLPGWVGRNTLGRGSRFIDNRFNKTEEGKAKSKFAAALLNIPAKQSYDVRESLSKVPVVKDRLEKEFGKPGGKGGWDEYRHHKDAEDKKKADALAKAQQEHADPKAEQKEQEKYRQEYGAAAFDARVTELIHGGDSLRKQQVELTKEQVQLAKVTQSDIEKMGEEAKKAHFKLVEDNQKSRAINKKELTNTENTLKTLKGMGQRIVENRHKEHVQEVAIKLMASKNTVKYMAGKKMLTGKSNKDKLAEAAKVIAKEPEDGDEVETPAAGGDAASAGGEGAQGHA